MPSGPTASSLAESWSVSADGLVYDFLLRSGIKFHKGETVTADDVKFSFERYRGANAQLLKEKMKEVRVVDPRRIQFRLKEPWSDFITFYGTTATSASWSSRQVRAERGGTAQEGAHRRRPLPGVARARRRDPEAFEGYWRKVPRVQLPVLRSPARPRSRRAEGATRHRILPERSGGEDGEDVRARSSSCAATPSSLDFRDQWEANCPGRSVRLAASLPLIAWPESGRAAGFVTHGNVVPRAMESP